MWTFCIFYLGGMQDWELIVTDNGSSALRRHRGGVRRSAYSPCPRGGLNGPRSAPQPGGRATASSLRGDADDICFPDRLSRQVARLREDPELDLT